MSIYYYHYTDVFPVNFKKGRTISRFWDCKLIASKGNYAIELDMKAQDFFFELLRIKFPYFRAENKTLWFVWDTNKTNNSVKTDNIKKNSGQFFGILEYLWRKNKSKKNVYIIAPKKKEGKNK